MPVSEYFSEVNRLDQIVPASRNQAEILTSYVSMRDYHKATAIIQVGAIAANGIVNAKLIQATDTLGAGAKEITGKAITALGDTDDNKMCVIELDTSELDVANQYDCIALQINTGGNSACLCSGLLVRWLPRFKKVDNTNLEEIVSA
jgi:hypothetical protein